MYSAGRCRGVEDVIVAEDFTFAAAPAMADDVTGLGFCTRDAVNALTLSSLGLGGQPRFRFGFAFDRLGVQALLGPAFNHLCPPAPANECCKSYHGRFVCRLESYWQFHLLVGVARAGSGSSVAGFSLVARTAYVCMRITFNTRSQSKSGLRSPALAKSIIFLAMAPLM